MVVVVMVVVVMIMMMDINLCLKYTNRRRRWTNQHWESRVDGEYFKMCKILREIPDNFREYYRMNITTDTQYINNQQISFNIYYVFYSQCSHQHVSPGFLAIFRVILLLREYKHTNVVSCVVSSLQLKLQFRVDLCK